VAGVTRASEISDEGSRTGRSRSTSAFRMLNIAVFAPMASVNVRIATMVNRGDFQKLRAASRTS
jgi:hypothetical protein